MNYGDKNIIICWNNVNISTYQFFNTDCIHLGNLAVFLIYQTIIKNPKLAKLSFLIVYKLC
jgi:hypothetical protein